MLAHSRLRHSHKPHSIAGNNEHEKRALELAEGKLHYHPLPHAVAGNSAEEKRALALAEGKESKKARSSIAAGHTIAIAKLDEDEVTVQTKWGPLSAARAGRQTQLRAIEAHTPNMHFDKGVSPRKVEALLERAKHMAGERFPLRRMHVKRESPLVQLNQVQELNAIEKKMGHEQRAMELAIQPSAPLSSAHARDWRHAARGRRCKLSKVSARPLSSAPPHSSAPPCPLTSVQPFCISSIHCNIDRKLTFTNFCQGELAARGARFAAC